MGEVKYFRIIVEGQKKPIAAQNLTKKHIWKANLITGNQNYC